MNNVLSGMDTAAESIISFPVEVIILVADLLDLILDRISELF